MSHSMRSLFQQLFSGLWKKKRGGRYKKNISLSQGSVGTSRAFDSGVLKDRIISVYILLNTYSTPFYRYCTVPFFDRYKMLKGQRNQQSISIYLLNWKINRSHVIQIPLKISLKKIPKANTSLSLKEEIWSLWLCKIHAKNTQLSAL